MPTTERQGHSAGARSPTNGSKDLLTYVETLLRFQTVKVLADISSARQPSNHHPSAGLCCLRDLINGHVLDVVTQIVE
ncbi:hypothetical protein D3C72_2302780 [compost metagenome]